MLELNAHLNRYHILNIYEDNEVDIPIQMAHRRANLNQTMEITESSNAVHACPG